MQGPVWWREAQSLWFSFKFTATPNHRVRGVFPLDSMVQDNKEKNAETKTALIFLGEK